MAACCHPWIKPGCSLALFLEAYSLEALHRQRSLHPLDSPTAIATASPSPLQPQARLAELQAWPPFPLLLSLQLASCASLPVSSLYLA